MHRLALPAPAPRPRRSRLRPDPMIPVGYVNGRPVFPIAGGSGEGEGGTGEGGTGGAPAPTVPKPGPPADPAAAHQAELSRVATREKEQGVRAGKRAALDELAAAHGLPNGDAVAKFLADAKAAEQARMSETERREKELTDRETSIAAREATNATEQREVANVKLLARLGATEDNLDDAAAVLRARVAPDADDATVQAAAEALKKRRPELFGAPAAEPGTPPAPGGAPAPGQRPGAVQAKPGERGLAMARRRGHIKD